MRKLNAIELKVARTRKGFTQEYVASSLGISTEKKKKKERGESGFSPEQIKAVAKVLEMDQDQVNTIFFDGQLPKSNLPADKLPPGNSPGVEAPCT